MGNPTFKSYYQEQLIALPSTLNYLVPKSYTVRVGSDIIDKINLNFLIDSYKSRGG